MSSQQIQQPVFGFSSKEDSVNLEDIFSDWFTDDFPSLSTLAAPPQAQVAPPPQQPVAATGATYPPTGAQPMMYPPQGAYPPQPYMMAPQYPPQMSPVMQPTPIPGQMIQPGMAAPMMMQARPPQQPVMSPVSQPSPVVQQKQTTNYPPQGVKFEDGDDSSDSDDDDSGSKKKRPRTSRKMTEEQKVERRERNREHAKRSRVRKKFLLESLQKSVNALQEENDKLKLAIKTHLGDHQAEELMKDVHLEPTDSLIAADPNSATKILEDPDYTLVKALQTAQQNFVITDPSLPDNPIVYASQGFLNLTGYSMEQILGRNCRFLQGPETDPEAVDKIRRAIEEGVDGSVCLVNYREDGTTFWNQFFIAALRGADGSIVNYVGVQCKVSEEYAKEVLKAEKDKKAQIQQGNDSAKKGQPHNALPTSGTESNAATATTATS